VSFGENQSKQEQNERGSDVEEGSPGEEKQAARFGIILPPKRHKVTQNPLRLTKAPTEIVYSPSFIHSLLSDRMMVMNIKSKRRQLSFRFSSKQPAESISGSMNCNASLRQRALTVGAADQESRVPTTNVKKAFVC